MGKHGYVIIASLVLFTIDASIIQILSRGTDCQEFSHLKQIRHFDVEWAMVTYPEHIYDCYLLLAQRVLLSIL